MSGQAVRSGNPDVAIKPIDILLVEDNPGDARLAIEALRDSKVHNTLHTVYDGIEALAYVRQEGQYADRERPDLILLDLNLPKKDGREVLRELKDDPEYRSIPVVVLTSSQAEEDILKSYNLHANCFISKPIDLEQFVAVIQAVEEFWFSIVKLPKREEAWSGQ